MVGLERMLECTSKDGRILERMLECTSQDGRIRENVGVYLT